MKHDDVERQVRDELEAILCRRRGELAREIIGATMHHAEDDCGEVRRFGDTTAADALSWYAEDLFDLVALTTAPGTTW